jgi:hypothetical protein
MAQCWWYWDSVEVCAGSLAFLLGFVQWVYQRCGVRAGLDGLLQSAEALFGVSEPVSGLLYPSVFVDRGIGGGQLLHRCRPMLLVEQAGDPCVDWCEDRSLWQIDVLWMIFEYW